MKTELEYLYQRREIVKMDLNDISERIQILEREQQISHKKKSIRASAYADLTKKIASKKTA